MRNMRFWSGQVLAADGRYLYVFDRGGFYVCDTTTDRSMRVKCEPLKGTKNEKMTWYKMGWTETQLLIADRAGTLFRIPRQAPDGEWSDRFKESQLVNLHDSIKIDVYGKETVARQPSFVPDSGWNYDAIDELFNGCYRVRPLWAVPDLKYARRDEWAGNTAQVNTTGFSSWRTVVTVNGSPVEFRPNCPVNDVCFSDDGLVLYMLHSDGNVTMMDIG